MLKKMGTNKLQGGVFVVQSNLQSHGYFFFFCFFLFLFFFSLFFSFFREPSEAHAGIGEYLARSLSE